MVLKKTKTINTFQINKQMTFQINSKCFVDNDDDDDNLLPCVLIDPSADCATPLLLLHMAY